MKAGDNMPYNKLTFSENLNRFLKVHRENQSDLCALCGVSSSTASGWCNGTIMPRMDKVQEIADHFGCRISDLVENQASLPSDATPIDFSQYHRIPILGHIAAGIPIYAEQNIEGYTLTDLNGGAEYFALRVSGDSMNATRIQNGDLVIVRRQETVDNGEIAVVLVDGECATVKRFYATDSTVTLMPQSTNTAYQPQIYDLRKTRITVLGKVVKVEFSL